MPTAVPAMRGHFGSTEFFLITMHAKELSDKLIIPKDMEGWDDLRLEERFQREVNYNRVKKLIAPYLARDQDRFFGAFIVAMKNHEGVTFEEIGSVAKGMPHLYANAAKAFGFLNFQGNEILFPLDGQHRVAAIRFAISGRDEKGKEIFGLVPNDDVANDMCTVILVRYDEDGRKARRIFNKVNRYAKPTTKGENLITADDDIIAVIAREDIANEIIGSRLVRYQSNALSKKAHEFTTLSTVYEATRAVLQDAVCKKIDTTSLPDEDAQLLYKNTANKFWTELCNRIAVFRDGLQDPEDTGDEARRQIRADSLLGKPFCHWMLVEAILRLRKEQPDGSRLNWSKVANLINRVDWAPDKEMWQGVVMTGTRIMSGKANIMFAARFLGYYLGEPLDEEALETLRSDYQSRFGDYRALPDRLVAEE